MMNFLKSFFSNERSADEQAVLAAQSLERQRDVMVVDAYGDDTTEDEEEGDCAPKGGCGGCGCHR